MRFTIVYKGRVPVGGSTEQIRSNRVKLIDQGMLATRESKYIEFKSEFNVSSAEAWCEVIKDIIALANSGGGIIVFGVANDGLSTNADLEPIMKCDAADITNRIAKYTDVQFADLEIIPLKRTDTEHVAFVVSGTDVPIIFTRPGTYDIGSGKQKTAFSQGTLYFRHGAKSEPGNRNDLFCWRDREVARLRKSWLGGIRKVVEAPSGHAITVIPASEARRVEGKPISATISSDPKAQKVIPINAEDIWPHRQKDLIQSVNKSLPAGTQVNTHDILCINGVHDVLKTKPHFAYKPHRLASPQYSNAYVAWIIERAKKDKEFFQKTRIQYKAISQA